ncbi:MAG: hypothetical protein ACKPHU_36770, partial [Planctomycetaceae bacterium]
MRRGISVRRVWFAGVVIVILAWQLFGVGSPAGVLADEKAAPKLPAGVRMERDLLYVEGGDE